MKKINFILLFASIPLIPQIIGMAHFFIHGGVDWPMRWNNELVAWTVMLSTFALLSLYIAISNKYFLLSLMPIMSLLLCGVIFFVTGIEPSSKSDSASLELLAFWSQQWGYW